MNNFKSYSMKMFLQLKKKKNIFFFFFCKQFYQKILDLFIE